MASESNSRTGSDFLSKTQKVKVANEIRPLQVGFDASVDRSDRTAYSSYRVDSKGNLNPVDANGVAPQQLIRADAHSTDVWSTARALNVLREESYKFGGSPIIEKVLEDASRYLCEFGEIRSRAEQLARSEERERFADRRVEGVRQGIFSSAIYREGERVIRKREADKLRTETRKTSKKAVKRG